MAGGGALCFVNCEENVQESLLNRRDFEQKKLVYHRYLLQRNMPREGGSALFFFFFFDDQKC